MTIKTQVSELLGMEMDRREFLKFIGIGLLGMTSISTALRLMTPKQRTSSQNVGMVYGGAPYGGISKN